MTHKASYLVSSRETARQKARAPTQDDPRRRRAPGVAPSEVASGPLAAELLDDAYTEARDRKLYQLEGNGPIVREEDQAGLRPIRRRAAKTRASDDGPDAAAAAKAPVPRPASPSAARGDHPGSPTAESAASTADPDLDGDDASKSGVQESIPGRRPRGRQPRRALHSRAQYGPSSPEGEGRCVCFVVVAAPAGDAGLRSGGLPPMPLRVARILRAGNLEEVDLDMEAF